MTKTAHTAVVHRDQGETTQKHVIERLVTGWDSHHCRSALRAASWGLSSAANGLFGEAAISDPAAAKCVSVALRS